MDLGDTSDEEASPPQPKKKEMSKKSEDPNGFNATNAADRGRHEKGSFHHCCQTVHCLWNRVTCTHASGHIISPEFHSHKKNCGRWPMSPSEFIYMGIKDIPLWKQQTQGKLAMSLGVLKTMVHCWIVDSTIQVHSNSLKPVLTEENKVAQLVMALDSQNPQDPVKFLDMMDHIHMDEKWFFLSPQKERCSV